MRKIVITLLVISALCLYAIGAYYAYDVIYFIVSPAFWAGNIVIFLALLTYFNKLHEALNIVLSATAIVVYCCSSIFNTSQSKTPQNSETPQNHEDGISKEEEILKAAILLIQEHKHNLGNVLRKSISHDDYGNIIYDKWKNKEIQYFVENVLLRNITDVDIFMEFLEDPDFSSRLHSIIHSTAMKALEHMKTVEKDSAYRPDMNGIEYENYCKILFENCGWTSRITSTTGDQGIDLICEKNYLKIGVQCKHYNSTVGNKAVQEVASGLNYYNLQIGVVISNNSFTKSAKKLAFANKIILMNHSGIHNIDSLIENHLKIHA